MFHNFDSKIFGFLKTLLVSFLTIHPCYMKGLCFQWHFITPVMTIMTPPPSQFQTLAWRPFDRTQPFRGPATFPAICSLWTRLLRTVPSPCQCRSTSETPLESVLYAVNFKENISFIFIYLFRSKLSMYNLFEIIHVKMKTRDNNFSHS